MSDEMWKAVQAVVAACVTLWLAYQQRNIQKTADATHTLVNSNFGIQLEINAELAEQVVLLTDEPGAKAAATRVANLARKALADHQSKQHVVDSGNTIQPAAA